jgi:succinylglutamic semialdehyde dehydrogenase
LALAGWCALPLAARAETLKRFAELVKANRDSLAEAISREVGKPRWESLTEVDSMAAKVAISIEAHHERRRETEHEFAGARAATRYKPHGVMAVFGPFNFPGHLPNGHIVPALLAGNTVVFKPSERAPLVAERTARLWEQAQLPPGVLNLVQGAKETGMALASHPGIDGLLFTGSVAAGTALARAFAEQPGKILALEMGGNNPLVVHEVADLAAAAYLTVQSAYATAGQRCSCARRLIVPAGERGDEFIDVLGRLTRAVRVGHWRDEPEPFMGPVISAEAARSLLAAQDDLLRRGGRAIVEMRSLDRSPTLLSPGLIEVSGVADRVDTELFGPLLQVIRVSDFDAAIAEANNTRFGLAAALLSDNEQLWHRFFAGIRAGVVNWNRQTTSASSHLPFGGVGLSGNHRPSAYFAADYCSYPVAVIENARCLMPQTLSPGVEQ